MAVQALATGYETRSLVLTDPVVGHTGLTVYLISAGADGYYGTADDIHNY